MGQIFYKFPTFIKVLKNRESHKIQLVPKCFKRGRGKNFDILLSDIGGGKFLKFNHLRCKEGFPNITSAYYFDFYSRITNDDREEEMEENMQLVNTMIGNLRNMAIDMGSEVESQNKQADRIIIKVFFMFIKWCLYRFAFKNVIELIVIG